MNKAAESLKKYLEGYNQILDMTLAMNTNSEEIDKILDRINEIKQMISDLENSDKSNLE